MAPFKTRHTHNGSSGIQRGSGKKRYLSQRCILPLKNRTPQQRQGAMTEKTVQSHRSINLLLLILLLPCRSSTTTGSGTRLREILSSPSLLPRSPAFYTTDTSKESKHARDVLPNNAVRSLPSMPLLPRRHRHASPYGLGMWMVLLVIKMPLSTNRPATGWNSHTEPWAQVPSGRSSMIQPWLTQ